MGLGNSESDLIVDDGDDGGGGEAGGGGYDKSLGTVSCSICLEVVADTGDRSWAKLQCGHQFHLDCIGSAFNIKGVMQCPNCRKVEKGRWLFANDCRSLPEVNTDDWAHDEDTYYTVSEVLGVHYCPFGGSLARLPSSFEDGEFSLNAYHDLLGQHTVFAEHTAAVSSASHACPYIAYFGPIHHSSSSSSAGVSDTSNFNGHWNSPSVPSDMLSSYGFPAALDLQYHSWEHHQSPPFSTASGRIGGVDQSSLPPNAQRAVGRSNGPQRAGSFMHPFVINPGSGVRAGSSVPPLATPTYQGSNARARDRVQALQDYYQQQQPGSSPPIHAPPMIATSGRRPSSSSSSHRGVSRVIPPSTPEQAGFYFLPSGGTTSSGRNYQEAENASSRSGFRAWEPLFPLNNNHPERDSGWAPTYQQQGGSGSEAGGGIRSGSFRQRQNRS